MPCAPSNIKESKTMKKLVEKVIATANFLKAGGVAKPEIGMFAGTGLGESVESLEVISAFDYEEIPGFPVSTVQGHRGRLLFGNMKGKKVIAMQGRFHLYEGYSPLEVTFPVRVMRELGVGTLMVANAAGGLNPEFDPGDIMIISDHINLTGENPLARPNEDRWGLRFPDMSFVYDRELASLAESAAKQSGIIVRKGVYAGLKGPSLETPAEARYLRTIGADAVGFSTVMEVIAAVHAGMKVLGLSIVTNCHNPNEPAPATVESVIAVAREASPKLETIVRRVVEDATHL